MRTDWAGLLALGIAACGSPTSPGAGSIQPGLYVLAAPQPTVTSRLEYGDTLVLLSAIDFDSVRIVDDTLFERHYSLSDYRQRPGAAPVLNGSQEVREPGLLVRRDGQVLLVMRPFVPPIPPADPDVLSVRPEGLVRRLLTTRYLCDATACTPASGQYHDALYTRR